MEGNNMNNAGKPDYESLEKMYDARTNQVKELYTQLQQANSQNLVLRLEFLFKVLEHKDAFNTEFVTNCANEIIESLTIPEQDSTEQ